MSENAIAETHHSNNFEETRKLGARIGKNLRPGDLLYVHGDMGAGKTHLIQGIAKGLGIRELVNSPTYVYIHPYPLDKSAFYHIDLYRVQDAEKLKMIGMEELLYAPDTILAIEWPEMVQQHYPDLPDRNIIDIRIVKLGTGKRSIVISKKSNS